MKDVCIWNGGDGVGSEKKIYVLEKIMNGKEKKWDKFHIEK